MATVTQGESFIHITDDEMTAMLRAYLGPTLVKKLPKKMIATGMEATSNGWRITIEDQGNEA